MNRPNSQLFEFKTSPKKICKPKKFACPFAVNTVNLTNSESLFRFVVWIEMLDYDDVA